jgi:hypothetical protein
MENVKNSTVKDSLAARQGERMQTANGTSAAAPTVIPEFPENRQNNREFFKSFGPAFADFSLSV